MAGWCHPVRRAVSIESERKGTRKAARHSWLSAVAIHAQLCFRRISSFAAPATHPWSQPRLRHECKSSRDGQYGLARRWRCQIQSLQQGTQTRARRRSFHVELRRRRRSSQGFNAVVPDWRQRSWAGDRSTGGAGTLRSTSQLIILARLGALVGRPTPLCSFSRVPSQLGRHSLHQLPRPPAHHQYGKDDGRRGTSADPRQCVARSCPCCRRAPVAQSPESHQQPCFVDVCAPAGIRIAAASRQWHSTLPSVFARWTRDAFDRLPRQLPAATASSELGASERCTAERHGRRQIRVSSILLERQPAAAACASTPHQSHLPRACWEFRSRHYTTALLVDRSVYRCSCHRRKGDADAVCTGAIPRSIAAKLIIDDLAFYLLL